MRLIALDPGGTTGAVKFQKSVTTNAWNFMERRQFGPHKHHKELWSYLCLEMPDIIVYEQFYYQRRPIDKGVSLVLDSKEYIGVIELYGALEEVGLDGAHPTKIVVQSPSDMKFWDDTKLKRLGEPFYKPPPNQHSTDAIRHALYYISFTCKDNDYIKRLK